MTGECDGLIFRFPYFFENTILVHIISTKKSSELCSPFSQTSQLPRSKITLAFADVVIVVALVAKSTANNGYDRAWQLA